MSDLPTLNAAAWFQRGLDCVDQGDFDLGRDAFDQALQFMPDKPNLWWNRAQCNLALGDLQQAQNDLEQLLRRSPEHASGHAVLGKLLLKHGHRAAGVRHLIQAWHGDPSNLLAASEALDAVLLLEGHEDQVVELALEMAAKPVLSLAHVQRILSVLLLAPEASVLAHRLWLGLVDLPKPQDWMLQGWIEHCLSLSQLEEAALACERWIQASPNNTEAKMQLASVFAAKGDFSAALPLLYAYIQSEEGRTDVPAWCRMVRALFESRTHEQEAGLLCQMAIQRFPDRAEVWRERAHIFLCLGEPDLAIADFDKALALEPGNTSSLCNRAIGMAQKGLFAQALQELDQAVERSDAAIDLEVINTRGILLNSLGRFDDVEQLYRRVLATGPQPRIAVNLAFCLLVQGKYPEGFALLSQRERVAWAQQRFYQALSMGATPWQGSLEDAIGKHLLVVSQNGVGDTIQFARFLPFLQNQGVQVTLQAPARTEELLRSMHPDVAVIDDKQALPVCDLVADVHSLPGLLGITIDTIDAFGPANYLRVSAEHQRRMQIDLGPRRGLRVAVCWRGTRSSWAERSMPLALLADLEISGVEWFSLQFGPLLADELEPASRMALRHDSWSFSDAAAAMTCMDVVVSIDTVHAHIAGALGLPTCVMLNAVPEWRWGLQGKTTPWYGTAQLFRQEVYGAWDKPLAVLLEHFHVLMRQTSMPAQPLSPQALLAWAHDLEPGQPELLAPLVRRRAEQFAHQMDAEQALTYAQLALALDKSEVANWNCVGRQFMASGCYEQAQAAFEHAILLQPRDVQAQLGCAHVQLRALALEPALATSTRAFEQARHSGREMDVISACQTHAMVLRALNRLDEAEHCLRGVMAEHPHHELAQALGQLRLLRGDDVQGWRWLQLRDRQQEFAPHTQAACQRGARLWTEPGWAPLVGKHLLVTTENGHGDTFQFCRFLPWLVEQGIQVTLLSHTASFAVMRQLEPKVQVLPDTLTWSQTVPPADWVCDAQWLPVLLEVPFHQLDRYGPAAYLQNSASELARLKAAIPDTGRLRVGLAWRGQSVGLVDRSIPLECLAKVGSDQVDWYSLQIEPLTPAEKTAAAHMGMATPDWSFQDKAAAMGVLDLIVSVDTANAHLAGALGRPCLVLLTAMPDWRWGQGGQDSIWYPTVRLLRQTQPGAWAEVMETLHQALHPNHRQASWPANHQLHFH